MTPESAEVITAVLNLASIVLVLFFLAWGLRHLADRYPDGEYRFLFRALCAWSLSWIPWLAIWLLVALRLSSTNRPWIILLSDLNTVLTILTFFGLARGREFGVSHYFILGAQLFLAVGTIDLGFYGFGATFDAGAFVTDLQTHWSIALSVIGPPLLGWAFMLRSGTSSVMMAGFAYAALQPFAYEALQLHPFHPVRPDWIIAILAVLALLKIIYAAVVLACFGKTPATSDNLIRPTPAAATSQSPWGARAPLTLVIAGTAAILLIAAVNIRNASQIFGYLSGFVAFVAALIEILDRLGSHFHLWVSQAGQNAPPPPT